LLKRPLQGVTTKTITDPEVLRQDIEQVRRRGWAQIREEMHLDVGGVAAVSDLTSDVMIGMGVTYPMHRASEGKAESYGRLVQDFANRAAQLIGPRILQASGGSR
jgi:DNA-binding IclR family transcriptional regulator